MTLGSLLFSSVVVCAIIGFFVGLIVSSIDGDDAGFCFVAGAFGGLFGLLVFLLLLVCEAGAENRRFALISNEQNLYYYTDSDENITFSIEHNGKEKSITVSEENYSIKNIEVNEEPYAIIDSWADLNGVIEVVLYVPEDDCQTDAKKECAESGSYDAKSIQILLDAGYTIYFNGQLQGEDFRIESLNLKNYLISHDADKKEVYIMDK